METRNVLIIGGMVLGPKAACRVKRLKPHWQVTLVDQQADIAYSACGIPYFLAGDVPELQELMTTSFHMVRSPAFFENAKDVRLKTRTRALSINRQAKKVRVRHLDHGHEEELPYDYLVLATGSQPVPLSIPGSHLPEVINISTLQQAQEIKNRLSRGEVARAVIIGGGPEGCQLAAAISDLWGVETTLMETHDQLFPGLLDLPLARMVLQHLQERGVEVLLQQTLKEIYQNSGDHPLEVVTADTRRLTDLVITALGRQPQTDLAAQAGLLVRPGLGIVVNDRLQTSDPDIYAAGGCAALTHLITGKPVYFPEVSLAHRQGRIIGTNLAGGYAIFPGVVGSFACKVFDLAVAGTGLTLTAARQEGLDPLAALVVQQDHAHFFPQQELIYLQLVVDRQTQRLLGAQGVSHNGDALVGRINSIAALLQQRASLADLANLEMAYSPPLGTALDIVNTAANTAENIIAGYNQSIDPEEFSRLFLKESPDNLVVLDVRGAANATPFVNRFGERWLNIPQETLRHRFSEVPKDKKIILVCNAGMRSYEALRQLQTQGFDNAVGLQGGVASLKKAGLLR